MGKPKGKSAATNLSEEEMSVFEQKVRNERTSKTALIRECILTLADYTSQERLLLKTRKSQVKTALFRTELTGQDDIESLIRALEKSHQTNRGFLKAVVLARQYVNDKNNEVKKLKRKLDKLLKKHGGT